jgi:hypothetical protein
VKIPLILRKIFENMAAESGSLQLKVGEFTYMEILPCGRIKPASPRLQIL